MSFALPPVLQSPGDIVAYLDVCHEEFCNGFRPPPVLRGRPVTARFNPPLDGRAPSFWHVVTASPGESTQTACGEDGREIDMRRLECVHFIRPIVLGADRGECPAWFSDRGERRPRVLLAPPDFSHVVILSDEGKYFKLISSYPIQRDRRREEHRRAFAARPF
jgi:hypothetical protein